MTDVAEEALPNGWAWTTLAQLASPEENAITDGPFGSNLKTEHYTKTGPRVIRLQNIGDGRFRDAYAYISEDRFRALKKHAICSGDLAIATLGDTLPRACVVPEGIGPAIVKADCIRFHPNSNVVLAAYLNYALNSPETRRRTSSTIHGVGRPRLRLAEIKAITLPLAPRDEQSRIADALDELFSDLDAGVAALVRVREKLNLYRASVLKEAVEGALTAEWRAQHPHAEPATELLERILTERRHRWEEDQVSKFKAKAQEPSKSWKAKYKEPVAPDTTNLPPLPDGWCWASTDQLSSEVKNGYSLKPDAESGVPILRISAVRAFALDLTDVRYLAGTLADFADSLIRPRDLLFTRYNGTRSLVGVCAIVPTIDQDIVHPDKVIRARPLSTLQVPTFVALAANTGASRAFVEQRIRTTAGQAGVSGSDIRELPLPLAPAAEQEAIVEIVEDQLSVIDHLEGDLDAKLKNAQSLRQAILRHAFTGQLVPQDPNDEPASELLKRIAAERQRRAVPSHPRRRAASRRSVPPAARSPVTPSST